MSQITFQCDNVAFIIALREGDNVTWLELMSQLMLQCDNDANKITLYECRNVTMDHNVTLP